MREPVRFESERFTRSFRARVARSKSSLPVVTNKVLYDVSKASVDEVQRADRPQIESLGVVAYRVLKKKGGLLKNRKIIYGNAQSIRMGAIYAEYLRKKGIDPKSIPAAEFQYGVQRALSGRLKAIGFVASAFVPVLRKLAATLGIGAYRPAQAQPLGKPKGNATPAVDGWKCAASFEVSAGLNVESAESRMRVRSNLERAISAGLNKTADSLERYAEQELNKVWRS